MPASKDVGTNIKNLRASKTKRPPKQILAIALSEARRKGNKSIKPPGVGEAKGALNKKAIKKGRVGRGEDMPSLMGSAAPMGGASPMGGGQTILTGPDGTKYQLDPMTGKATKMSPGMPAPPPGGGMGGPNIGIGEQVGQQMQVPPPQDPLQRMQAMRNRMPAAPNPQQQMQAVRGRMPAPAPINPQQQIQAMRNRIYPPAPGTGEQPMMRPRPMPPTLPPQAGAQPMGPGPMRPPMNAAPPLSGGYPGRAPSGPPGPPSGPPVRRGRPKPKVSAGAGTGSDGKKAKSGRK